jgi:phosphoribosylformylglycinamidine synthase
VISALIAGGQVATQYTDENGTPSMDIRVNPNGSLMAIEGIFSPDGRVLGKMGHTERRGIWSRETSPAIKCSPFLRGHPILFINNRRGNDD